MEDSNAPINLRKKEGVGNPNQMRGQIKGKIFAEIHGSIASAFNSRKLSVADYFRTSSYPVDSGKGNPYPRRGRIKIWIMQDISAAFRMIFGLVYF